MSDHENAMFAIKLRDNLLEKACKSVYELKARVGELEAIVREIAESEPVEVQETSGSDVHHCRFCCGWAYHPGADLKHDVDCVWVRARRAMGLDAQEAKT